MKPKNWKIVDNKNFGSYKVASVMGIQKTMVSSTTEVYKKSGNWGKAGTPKQIPVFTQHPEKADLKQETLQLNHYRVLAKDLGYNVTKLQLQITVRDGGTIAAKTRGIFENIYYPVPVPMLPDEAVRGFYEVKRLILMHHLLNRTLPEPCNDEEAWDGRRCVDFCDVTDFCPKGKTERFKAGRT